MLALPHLASGKVREIYAIDDERLLFVATDRISAYDVILTQPIPDKGRVLTGLSLHFFDLLDAPNHFLSTDLDGVDGLTADDRADLAGRAMVVRRCEVVPVECVVRGYLYGSSWNEYAGGGGPTTEHLPSGLQMADKLPEPIFTPATKATSGHDENITESQTRRLLGDELYEELRRRSLDIYNRAADYAAARGVILADTKFEFGHADGELLLIDEVLTPDSSRYWPADEWQPGHSVPSYDKQYVRDWLDSTGWDHEPPPPDLPDEVVGETRGRYVEAYERITGRELRGVPGGVKVTVHIERRPEIADPEGATIARSLADLGYDEVTAVRTGRTLHLDVAGTDPEAVRTRVTEMCEKLLANPVIEDYRIEVEP